MNGPRYIESNLDEALYRQRYPRLWLKVLPDPPGAAQKHRDEEGFEFGETARPHETEGERKQDAQPHLHLQWYDSLTPEKNASINRENEVLMTKLI